EHLVRIEVRLGHGPCGLAVFIIVLQDAAHTRCGLVRGPKLHEAQTLQEILPKAGVQHQDGLAGGQVARTPVTEPATVRLGVDPLGDGEFATRALNVRPEGRRVGNHFTWIDDTPAIVAQCRQVPGIPRMDVQGDLEDWPVSLSVPTLPWEAETLAELMDLQPV